MPCDGYSNGSVLVNDDEAEEATPREYFCNVMLPRLLKDGLLKTAAKDRHHFREDPLYCQIIHKVLPASVRIPFQSYR